MTLDVHFTFEPIIPYHHHNYTNGTGSATGSTIRQWEGPKAGCPEFSLYVPADELRHVNFASGLAGGD